MRLKINNSLFFDSDKNLIDTIDPLVMVFLLFNCMDYGLIIIIYGYNVSYSK